MLLRGRVDERRRTLLKVALLPADLNQVADRWAAAELAGDAAELEAMPHPNFLFAGPYCYLLGLGEWFSRTTPGTRHYAVATTLAFAVDSRPASSMTPLPWLAR